MPVVYIRVSLRAVHDRGRHYGVLGQLIHKHFNDSAERSFLLAGISCGQDFYELLEVARDADAGADQDCSDCM